MLAEFFAVLAETQLFRSVHRILRCVVYALTRLFTHESDQFALFTFFCHICNILTKLLVFVNKNTTVIVAKFGAYLR